jgi:hypothetical protein
VYTPLVTVHSFLYFSKQLKIAEVGLVRGTAAKPIQRYKSALTADIYPG